MCSTMFGLRGGEQLGSFRVPNGAEGLCDLAGRLAEFAAAISDLRMKVGQQRPESRDQQLYAAISERAKDIRGQRLTGEQTTAKRDQRPATENRTTSTGKP